MRLTRRSPRRNEPAAVMSVMTLLHAVNMERDMARLVRGDNPTRTAQAVPDSGQQEARPAAKTERQGTHGIAEVDRTGTLAHVRRACRADSPVYYAAMPAD